MALRKKSLAVLALAGFTSVAMVSHTTNAKGYGDYLTPYEEEEEQDLDIVVRENLSYKLVKL